MLKIEGDNAVYGLLCNRLTSISRYHEKSR